MLKKSSNLIKVTNPVIIILLVLSVSACMLQDKSKKHIGLTSDGWKPVSEQYGDEPDSFNYQVNAKNGGLEFSITGNPGSLRSVRWAKEIDEIKVSDCSYMVMEYQANWLNNPYDEVVGLTFSNDKGVTKDTTVLKMLNLIVDGRPHTVIVKNPVSGLLKKLSIRLNTRSSNATLFIKSIDFVKSEKEFSAYIVYSTPAGIRNTSLQCIDITKRYNSNFAEVQKGMFNLTPVINDGGKYFSGSDIEINGIPFQVKPDGMNLLGFPAESKLNEDTITHFGNRVRRGSVAPISRDDIIEVNVQSPASEIYFLLCAENPRTCLTDPKNLMFMFEDIETFAVELVYADGTIDFAFPYSIHDERHIIQGTLGVYLVPASGKSLNKVVFHNRTFGKNYYLGAVTINKDQKRLFPQLVMEPGPKPLQEPEILLPSQKAPFLQYQNGIVKLGNSFIEMTIDAKNAFTITDFKNKWLGEKTLTLNPTPGFQIAFEKENVDAKDIKLLSVSDITGRSGKEITLNYGIKNAGTNLDFKIQVSISEEPEVGMQMTAVNTSAKDIKAKVVFPILNGVQLGKGGDVWYYYPSYRNVFSNQNGTFDHIYSLSFPVQFYDVYNPTLGGGFYMATRETDVDEMRRYGFRKNESGIMCYLEYPKLNTLLKSNIPYTLCKTVLGVHKGDWHVALDTYKQWLGTWYKPFKSQDKQWYKECFWLLCEYPDNIPYDLLYMHTNFTWYDTIKKHYRMRDILDEHKRTVGRYPDILHFWCWTQNMPRDYMRWGSYGANGEYEKMGGINNFNLAINDIQKNMGINVSLYIDASLCNTHIPIAKQIGPGAAMHNISGEPVIEYDSYRMCPGSKDWREYMNKVYLRVKKDLGVNILYVDEWAAPFNYGHIAMPGFTCYSAEHGHTVPANMNLEVNTYMRELRTSVPKGLALYGEYPDVDVNTRFYDSNINYYLATSTTDLKEGRDNIAYDLEAKDAGLSDPYMIMNKFVFPGMVQLILPNDAFNYSWNRMKFTFLNGDAIYDNFWMRDESKAEAFLVRSHDIKLKYADCFTSNTPEPLVSTIKSGIMANKFPGKSRTLWTIYNQRYTTVRGEIMKVKHVNGAAYYDAWNNKPLQTRISGDDAFITLELYPQAIGCVVQLVK